MKIVGLMIVKRSTVQRTTRRGPFLTVARTRERIAMYKSGYSNITYGAQKKNDRVGLNKRPKSLFIYILLFRLTFIYYSNSDL